MLANKDVNSIKLDTRLGNCALGITAQLRNDDKARETMAQYALQFLIWHIVPASAYDKKSAYKRNSEYSDGLAKHMRQAVLTDLNDCFDSIQVKTAAYEKPDPIAKLIKEFKALGMSDEDATAMAKSVQDKIQPKSEAKVEAEVEV